MSTAVVYFVYRYTFPIFTTLSFTRLKRFLTQWKDDFKNGDLEVCSMPMDSEGDICTVYDYDSIF
jgi:hypothetical protein